MTGHLYNKASQIGKGPKTVKKCWAHTFNAQSWYVTPMSDVSEKVMEVNDLHEIGEKAINFPKSLSEAVLWNSNDLLRFRLLLWKSFGSGSGSSSGSILMRQNLAFPMLEATLFPRKSALMRFSFRLNNNGLT